MMIGDDHAHAARARRGDARVAGDAVVDGDEQVGRRGGRVIGQRVDQGRRKAIAVAEPVRYAIVDVARAQQAQAAHGDSRAVAPSASKSPTMPMRRSAAIASVEQRAGAIDAAERAGSARWASRGSSSSSPQMPRAA